MNEELIKVNLELRKLDESLADGSMTAEKAETRFQELKAQKREIEQHIAKASMPRMTEASGGFDVRELRDAMVQKRAITLNGTGMISQMQTLVTEMSRKKEILNHVNYFFGSNATMMVPVLSPPLAAPAAYPEGANNVAMDTQANISSQELRPRAFVSTLPVTAEAIAMGSVNIEAELPNIFTKAFARGFATQVVTGDGTGLNFDGLFNNIHADNRIQSSTVGRPTIADFVTLATTLSDYAEESIIVTHPHIYGAILADSSPGIAERYKDELIKNKTIEGVKVLVTSYAPSSIAAGATFAVGGNMDSYGVAVAGDLNLKPKYRVGDTHTYFEATIFTHGAKIVERDFYGLIAR